MQNVKVLNLESPRTGKPVANQFVITTPEGEYFQSYQSVIAFVSRQECVIPGEHIYCRLEKKITLDGAYWDYSRTTTKYLYAFLRSHGNIMTREEIKKALVSGDIISANLND